VVVHRDGDEAMNLRGGWVGVAVALVWVGLIFGAYFALSLRHQVLAKLSELIR